MQTRRSDEFIFTMDTQWRFDVEGMTARQSDELTVTRNPFVGCADVTMIGVCLEIPHGLGGGDDGSGCRLAVFGDGGDGNGGGVRAVEFEAGGFVGVGGDGGEVGDGCGGFDECG
jgi:hypothetical protein